MSYDGNGTYNPPTPAYPAIPNTVISSNDYNTVIDDLAAALSIAWPRDGQAAATGQMSMGGFKLVALAAGSAPTDAVNFLQVFTDPHFLATSLTGVEINGTALTVSVTTADFSATAQVDLPANTFIGTLTPADLMSILGKANLVGGNVFTGLQVMEADLAGTSTAVTQLPADSTLALATTQFVQQVAMNAALPSQAGNAFKFPRSDGTNVTWEFTGVDVPLFALGIY